MLSNIFSLTSTKKPSQSFLISTQKAKYTALPAACIADHIDYDEFPIAQLSMALVCH